MNGESRTILRRLVTFVVLLGASASLLASAAAPAGAAAPWWEVLTGARPTILWEPSDNVQELEGKSTELLFGGEPSGFVGAAAKVMLGDEAVACLGTQNFVGEVLCPNFYGLPLSATAGELQAALEAASGAPVEVTGGPVDGEPFVVTFPSRGAPTISFYQDPEFSSAGEFSAAVLSPGGSGRLTLSLVNIGDAPVDATKTPLVVEDQLPEGAFATEVTGFVGAQAEPADCTVDGPTHVTCTFEGIIPPYEALDAEILVNLGGEPPKAGEPGKVTVSGGNAPPASASQPIQVGPGPTPFGIERFSAKAEEEGGMEATQAGSHPFQLTSTVQLNSGPATGTGEELRVDQPAQLRNLHASLPIGLVGNATAVSRCEISDFFAQRKEIANQCPDDSAVGVINVAIQGTDSIGYHRLAVPVFNLVPGHGEPARFGFTVLGNPVVVNTAVDPDDQYRVIASFRNTTQLVQLLSGTFVLWGSPGDPRHDSARGWGCAFHAADVGPCARPSSLGEDAFLRLPVSCATPLSFEVAVEPWNVPPGAIADKKTAGGGTLSGCNQISFNPYVQSGPTSKRTDSPSGLDFRLEMPNANLNNPDGIAEGQAKKVEVTLPEGVTLNPSQANGLSACSPQEYAREKADSAPGDGCPESSKIGSVAVATPLLEEEAHGSVFVAAPYDNSFDSLLALYVVARIPERGILIKQAGKVELNPETGQLLTTFDDLPQIPFSTFDLHFAEGDRAPLVMPPSCGSYDLVTKFTPWNAADPNDPQPDEIVTRTSSFSVDHGVNGGACPSGKPPFNPGFTAGTVNNAAGRYSPLKVRLTREDGEQEFKTFSLKMPKGVIGKLAGIPFCSDAAVAAARTRTGPNGGQEELDHPSCPEASQIGTVLVGAGVGPTLTYAPGKLYLAGPYKGTKLSVVAVTTAKVGPFDLGNVVIRQGLKVDPNTAQVSTDGSSADPIPHILKGIVVHARDIRINVDRKDFILNPTSCERMKAAASVLGSGNDTADVSVPFQAADCARLGFKPKLSLSLNGGTRRGAHPRLKAVLKARKGDANIGAAVVKLPHSEFLEQGHIRTICTRVQFAAGSGNGSRCPKGSVYGRARAISPLLDEPLVGPVYLRSSNHALPDLVAALHSKRVDINLDGRIDAVNGGIRNSFEAVPDAPVTKFVLEMQGGRKGLLVNSTNICQGKHRARVNFTGQNGKRRGFNPLLKAACGGKHKRRS
jgi:hypothetical protein